MARLPADRDALRRYRNTRLYRSLTRTLRVYNRTVIEGLHARGFTDFSPAFPALLSNLDVDGTRIGLLAKRAGVTRQAAGQLLKAIERCGYVETSPSPEDARAVIVRFTARGRKLFANIVELVQQVEDDFAARLPAGEFDRIRRHLLTIADQVDPDGALGVGDLPQDPRQRASRGSLPR